MTPSFRFTVVAILSCLAATASSAQQGKPAVPLDPITTIIDAFRSEGHLVRQGRGIVQLLESSSAIKLFTIATPISMPTATPLKTLQADAGSWPVPSIAMLQGTVLGAADITAYFTPVAMMREGKPAAAGQQPKPLPSLQDQFDALLYIGEPSTITMSRLSPERCADAAYMEMRRRRIALMPPQLSAGLEDRLTHECALP